MKIADVVKQLDVLLREGNKLAEEQDPDEISLEILANRLEAAVIRLTMQNSIYRQQIQRGTKEQLFQRFLHNCLVAHSLRADLKAGWTDTVVELVHADTYSDYLEMAEALLAKGYKDAAAVITGTSLEVHVRALCVKNGVTTAVAGKLKKANTMSADLKKAGVYDGLQEKKVTAWMDLRNKAAHGDYSTYDKSEVGQFIEGVRTFLVKYPA